MKIAAISYSFPHASRPYNGMFVRNTLAAMADLGAEVMVIAPQRYLLEKRMPFFSTYNRLKIYRPRFVSFGALKAPGIDAYRMTLCSFEAAVRSVLRRTGFEPEAIYSHFLLPSGRAAARIAKHLGARSLCVLGESNPFVHEAHYAPDRLVDLYLQFDGLITNSTAAKEGLTDRYRLPADRITVVPNAVDTGRFHRKDPIECRKRLGLPADGQIVVFTGALIDRKGPLRVLEACRRLTPRPWMVFAGSGPQVPVDSHVLHCGPVSYESLADYLNASNVFALPTLEEGMSNAVLEAMACELPVVTSPIRSNVELLGPAYPFFCNPLDIDGIAGQIESALRSDHLSYDRILTTRDRAGRILSKLSGSRP